jgi:peptidoglycan/LPS O-acetylase OafA/YrhL
LKYRADVDGLRAIAVLSVMAFHYGVPVRGGFAGVDVFFVISGFLITQILFAEMQAGKFSLLGFYDRRIRRILPALLVMLSVTLLVGRFLLMPGDYQTLAASAAAAAFGASNFYFLNHTGYFDQAADLMPLLHTWSLAVEEQFYLVWPGLLLLIVAAARKRADAAVITAVVTIAIFGASLVYFTVDVKGAFYMAPPRAWELALGALLVLLPALPRFLGSIAKFAGLALIGYGFVRINANSFPYIAAVLPCVGAALVIWPCESDNAPARWLGKLAPIGLISYSLYLWHWPIWVFFRIYINHGQPQLHEALALGIASILAATLSYRLVECPFRTPRFRASQNVWVGLAGSLALFCAAMFVHSDDGIPGRIPETASAMQSLDEMWDWPCSHGFIQFPWMTFGSCRFGPSWETAPHKAFLWGDSHAEHIAPILEAASDDKIAFTLYVDCPAALGEHVFRPFPGYPRAKSYRSHCTNLRENAINYLQQNPDIHLVVFAASWKHLSNVIEQDGFYARSTDQYELLALGLRSLIEKTQSPHRKFLIIADVPQFHHDPIPCALSAVTHLWRRYCDSSGWQITTSDFLSFQGGMYQALEAVAKTRSDVDVILPGREMCKGQHCLSSMDGEYLYRDDSHIRRNLRSSTKLEFARLIGLTTSLAEMIGP